MTTPNTNSNAAASTSAPGHDSALRRTALGQMVRDALAHLYDLPYLQTHALASAVPQPGVRTAATGQLLQQRLLHAIESLRPTPETPPTSGAWRRHRLMTLRYVEGMDVPEVCTRTGISRTEYYRDHNPALEAVIAQFEPVRPTGSDTPAMASGAAAGRGGPVLRLPARTPLVGRADELALLRAEFEAVAGGEGGRLLLLGGEPGVGKTRLVQELGNTARQRGGSFLEGRYLRDGTTPYLPWVEALRAGLRGLSRDELAQVVGPYGSELAQVFPELAAQVGPFAPSPPLPPEEQRLRLYDGLTGLLLHLAGNGPLVLLLDDIQWAPSLSLLTHMARRLGQATALIVGVYRDQEFRETPSLMREWADLNRARLFRPLALRPLAEEQTGQMVAHYFGSEAAASLRERVHRTTKGNPFFIEEVVRSLAESGAVQPGLSGWEVAEVERVSIPESIKLVIDERVGRLGDGARDVLGQAAVLGQEFSFPVLAAMSGLDEGELVGQVERATAARLLADRSARGGERYAFVDDQVQEALYAGISSVRRRRWHLRAGEAIEQVHAANIEGHLEELTRHFVEGNDTEKAADYAYRAGRKADQIFAWSRSISLYSTALELWEELGDHVEQRAAVCEQLGDATYKLGIDPLRSIAHLQQALTLYEQAGNRRKQATIHSQLGRAYGASTSPLVYDNEKALEHQHAARAILEELGESVPLGLVYCGLAMTYSTILDLPSTKFWAAKGLELGERLKSPPVIAQACVFLGQDVVRSGEIAQGFVYFERAWQIASDHRQGFLQVGSRVQGMQGTLALLKYPRELLNSAAIVARSVGSTAMTPLLWSQQGLAHVLLGEFEQAMSCLWQMERSFETKGNLTAGFYPEQRGVVALRRGEWSRAEQVLAEGLRWVLDAHQFRRAVPTALVLGQYYLELGEYARAHEQFVWALDRARRGSSVLDQVSILPHLCVLEVRTGQVEEAQQHLTEAQAILANGEEWCGLAGDVALAEMLVRAAQGRHDGAAAAFQRAVAVYQRYELKWDEAKLYYEWGCILAEGGGPLSPALSPSGGKGADGGREEARRLLVQAMEMWDGMGAGPYAERCRQELAELT